MAPPLGRDGLRAGRPAREQAPLRHGRRASALSRQAVHGLRHAPAARAGHGRHGADRLRRATSSRRTRRLQPHQRELAARLGRDDARRGARLRRGEPGGDHDAVHPRRRDEPGDGGGDVRTDARRVAGRAWRTCQLVRPGAPVVLGSFACSMSMQSGAPTFGTPEPALVLYVMAAARPPARRAVPLRRSADRVEDPRRAGGLRVGQHDAADDARRRRTSCSTPPAGSRAGSRWGTRSSSSTPTSSACGTRSARGSTSPTTARRSTRS